MERLLKMKIKTKDKIVRKVLRKMDKRSIVGQKKYGQTMENEIDTGKKDLRMFLTDVQEEIMDALLYIEAAKRCLTEEIEEAALKQFVLHDEEEEL
jgi:ribosomal protein S19E (S16A)